MEKSDNIFSGLPLSTNLVPTSDNILTSRYVSSLSSSYKETTLPQISTNKHNNNNGYFLPRKPSRSITEMSDSRNLLNFMTSPKLRRAAWTMPKPSVFNQSREREKTELSSLNDKLADYVEKVRYLESQNKKIQLDSNLLIEKDRENSQKIRSLFEEEIGQLKELAEKLLKEKNAIFNDAQSAQVSIYFFLIFIKF